MEASERLTAKSFVAICSLALFLSALLLFWVQPLIAKLILPPLGGSPAVWTTCMAFFQTALLAGYAWAFALDRWLTHGRQLTVHIALLAFSAAMLPIAVASGASTRLSTSMPALTAIVLLASSIGLPFLGLAATAPLVQRWFARSGHPHAADPYFLYAASNLGSIGALAAFPLLFERLLGSETQARVWSAGYLVLSLLVAAIGGWVWRAAATGVSAPVPASSGASPGRRQQASWIVYAAVPASLLLGVTAHIATDIAAAPLLWVLPLSLYLLSFIIVFSRRPWFREGAIARLAPTAVIILAAMTAVETLLGLALPVALQLCLHLSVLFVLCLLALGTLYRRRPDASRLTSFYLALAFGGMVGGLATALLAPLLFDRAYEYPLALVAACLLLPRTGRTVRGLDVFGAGLILALLIGFDWLLGIAGDPGVRKLLAFLTIIPVIIVALAARENPFGFALTIAAVLAGSLLANPKANTVWQGRTFFGAYRIIDSDEGLRLLYHGTTVHGAEWIRPAKPGVPATYYAPDSPVAELIALRRNAGGLASVGVIGLGVGSLACYRKPGEAWRFYEIDPLVIWIAARSGFFRFLNDCPPGDGVVEGDGRLRLAEETGRQFDLLIVDAFSSDAIPLHLLTREAIQLYVDRLAPDGILLLHISNRHLDLAPVVGQLSADLHLAARIARNRPAVTGRFASLASDWIAISTGPEALDHLDLGNRWQPLIDGGSTRVWTDDYSNIAEAIRWW